MVARPELRLRSPQAIKVKGTTLLSMAWMAKRPHFPIGRHPHGAQAEDGQQQRSAITVRAAMNVMGGIVATPSLMKA